MSRTLRRHDEEGGRLCRQTEFPFGQGFAVRNVGQSTKGSVSCSGDEGCRSRHPLHRHGDVCDFIDLRPVRARTEMPDRSCGAAARLEARLRKGNCVQAALQRRP